MQYLHNSIYKMNQLVYFFNKIMVFFRLKKHETIGHLHQNQH